MDMSAADPVRDELLKNNQEFRELVHQHEEHEKRLSELQHLSFPSDEEQLEETALKRQKLAIKDEIYAMMHHAQAGH
ncbi:MAG: YdcH family protein [Acidobacteria bacterium]|nr:YdcH family protein [Acidobacteriota bacterium]HMM79485.1 YdcH family protein [Pyrinomonadaceae bacterium]HMU34244.1 YdcH family protein [Pyrinomonadaceae bacterium]